MNRHNLTYLELNPAEEQAPPVWAQILGGIFAAGVLYVSLVFFFSL